MTIYYYRSNGFYKRSSDANMPRPFNASEERAIREQLRKTGRRLFSARGVLKTSIEEIAQSAAIAKGSFYKFYGSKELLYFELLEETQNEIRAPLLDDALSKSKLTRTKFEKLVDALFTKIGNEPLVQFMGRENEFMAVARKVPPEILLAHQKDDQAFLAALIKKWNRYRKPPPRDQVAARMTLLLLVSLQRDFLGEKLFPHGRDAVISSLADCFFTPPRDRK